MNCEFCDTALQPGSDRCSSCGAAPSVAAPQPTRQPAHQTPHPPAPGMRGISSKSKIVAGLLGIFLGGIGVHNFYLGFTGKGIAQAALFVAGCAIPGLGLVPAIWGLIEGIIILTSNDPKDSEGMLLE